MFSTSGFFRGLSCPHYARGPGLTCRRPNCHFRHVRRDTEEQNKTSSVATTEKNALDNKATSTKTKNGASSKSDYVSTSLPNWKKKSKKLTVGGTKRRGAQTPSANYIPTPPLAQFQKKQQSAITSTGEEGFDNPFGHIESNHDEYDPTNASLGSQSSSSAKYSLGPEDESHQAGEYIPTSGCSQNVSGDKYSVESAEYDPLDSNESLTSGQKYAISTGPVTDLEYDPLENSSLSAIQSSSKSQKKYVGRSGKKHQEYDPLEGQSSKAVISSAKYSVDDSSKSDINTLYGVDAYDPLESVKESDGDLYDYTPTTESYSYSAGIDDTAEYHPTPNTAIGATLPYNDGDMPSVSPCKRKASSDISRKGSKKMKPGVMGKKDDEDDLYNWDMDAWFSDDDDDSNHKAQHKYYDDSSDDEPLVIDTGSNDSSTNDCSSDKISNNDKTEAKGRKENVLKKKCASSVKANEISNKKSDVDIGEDEDMQGLEITISADVQNEDKNIKTTNPSELIDGEEEHDDDDVEVISVVNDCTDKQENNEGEAKEPAQIAKARVSSEQLADFFSKRLQQPTKNKLKKRKKSPSLTENVFSSKSKSVSNDEDKSSSTDIDHTSKKHSDKDTTNESCNIFSLMTKSAPKDGTNLTKNEANKKSAPKDGTNLTKNEANKKCSEKESTENAKEISKEHSKKKTSKDLNHKSTDKKDSTHHKSSSSSSSSKNKLTDKHPTSDKKKLHKSSSFKDTNANKQKVPVTDKGKSSNSSINVCEKTKSGTGEKKSSLPEKGSAKNLKEISKETDKSKTHSSTPKDVPRKEMKEKSHTTSNSKHISTDKVVSKSNTTKNKTNKPPSQAKVSSSSKSGVKNTSGSSGGKGGSSKVAKTFDIFGSLSESSSEGHSSKKTPSKPKMSSAKKVPSKKPQKDVYDISSSSSDDFVKKKTNFLNKIPKEISRSQSLQNHSGSKTKVSSKDVYDLTSDSSDLEIERTKSSQKTSDKVKQREVHRSQSWTPRGIGRSSESSSSSSTRRLSEHDLFGNDSSGGEDENDVDEVVIVKETSKDDIKHEVINLLSSDESDDDETKSSKKLSSKKSSNGAMKNKMKMKEEGRHHKYKQSSRMKEKQLQGTKHSKVINSKHKHSKSDKPHKNNGEKSSVSSKPKEVLHNVNKKHSSKDKRADKSDKSKMEKRNSIHKDNSSVCDKPKHKSSKDKCKNDSAISKSPKKYGTPVKCVTSNDDDSDAENYAMEDDADVDIPEDYHVNDTDISFSETDTYEECLKIFNEETATLNDSMKKQIPPSADEPEEVAVPVVVGKKRVAHAPKFETSHMRKIPKRPKCQPSPAQVCHNRFLIAQKEALDSLPPMKQSPPKKRIPSDSVMPSTKRVAHIPNFAGPSSDATTQGNSYSSSPNKRISRIAPSSSSTVSSSSTPYVSNRRLIMERKFAAVHRANSGFEIPGKTLATTADKGGRRMAHVPTKVSPRPVIPASHGGKVPGVVRQRYLNLFIDEFLKTTDTEKEAFDLGLQEEKAIHDRASSKSIYLNLSINNLKRLRTAHADPSKAVPSSPPPKNAVSHSAVLGGKAAAQTTFTMHRSAARHGDQGGYQGKELYEKLQQYLLTTEQLWDNGYPRSAVIPGQAEVKEDERTKKPATADPNQKVCCRCGKTFLRRSDGQYITKESCSFHWGKLWRKKVGGMVDHRFSCCSGDSEAKGCCLSKLHVTEDKTSNLSGFMKTYSKTPPRDGYPGIYALDCEMCYTVQGMELTRVTVVDDQLKQVYDSLVKPDNPVVDYNTRFSGITEDDLKSVDTKLHNVQAVLLNMFSSDSILIGHSLESDMLSLKMIHETVIDTAVVFPHKLGPPLKRALRTLMAEFVKKIIQSDVNGHDSMEDAKSCMELMIWKVKEDAKTKR